MAELLPAGTTLSHYRILSPLGAGGMGEVYLAEDPRLGRKVAVKLLPARFTAEPARVSRFEREARAVSLLNHPNILTIYEIGAAATAAGRLHYIVTEFVEGETLRAWLERQGRLPLGEALSFAAQVAGALEATHAAGVTHRDIKPENVMLRPDGYVKVLDFGLAKLTERAPHASGSEAPTAVQALTESGMVMGTAYYMSPEQARGLDVDWRTDIFSLGVMLYEMVAGRRPFEGATVGETIAATLRDKPPPLAAYVAAPAELERILAKALSKERAARYRSARALCDDLQRLCRQLEFQAMSSDGAVTVLDTRVPLAPTGTVASTATAATRATVKPRRQRLSKTIGSLAVLPFVNAGSDADAEYLSDGITESVINGLSQLPKLRIVPGSTVFRYKGRDADPQQVGRELNVRAVLTGQVQPRGEWLIVKTELIDVAAERQLWGEHYRRKLTNIFALQAELATEISEQLRLRLSGEERRRLVKRYTENAEAYHLYLKGRYYTATKRTEEWIRKGIEHFRRAIDLDPNYALAYAGLADAYSFLASSTGGRPPHEVYPKAKAAALKALEIDESLSEAHSSLGFFYLLYDWDLEAAGREFERAIELNPSNANAHDGYGFFLKAAGRADEAVWACAQVEQLDPLSPFAHVSLGWAYYFARRHEEAITEGRKALELDPQSGFAYRVIGLGCEQLGRYEEAVAALQEAVRVGPGLPLYVAHLGHAYALAGESYGARRALSELRSLARQRYVSAYYFALVHLGLGEADEAFAWLERALDERAGFMAYLKVEPIFDPVRDDARFAVLLERVGLQK